ncbi:ATP-binding cassette domain-containing protein [Paenibacillus sp. P26]|nr:ATP-binding cassette domain-containing protein [Paenibacillus sp. P26]
MHILSGQTAPDQGTVRLYGKHAVIEQSDDGGPAQLEDTRSGGERTRARIEAALREEAEILFADEPTSHLDLQGIRRVERELVQFPGLVVLISHDRELLDSVCRRILEVENGKIRLYEGNYSDYRRQRTEREARVRFEYEQYTQEKKRLTEAIREKTLKAKGMGKPPKRMSTSESRLHKEKAGQKQEKVHQAAKALEKRLERLPQAERPVEPPEVRFDINGFVPVYGKRVLSVDRLGRRFGGRILFENVSFSVPPGAKVALVGPNGAGKSTLLGRIRAKEEGVRFGPGASIGYFHQSQALLDNRETILENVMAQSIYPEVFVRTVLARMLFKREEVHKPVHLLSGGEKVKTALAQVFLSGCNVLLLDEPTNYLDVFTRERLEEVLLRYPGTILFASHDRRLIDRLADRIILFEPGRVRLFHGTYREYLERPEAAEERQDESGGGETTGSVSGPAKPAIPAEEKLRLELELTEVLGRLSLPQKPEVKEALEERYAVIRGRLSGFMP